MRARTLTTTATQLALLAVAARPSVGFVATKSIFAARPRPTTTKAAFFMSSSSSSSSGSGSGAPPTAEIKHIGKAEMNEILQDCEAGGREESMYVVIDVRTGGEIANTGKLSPSVFSVPLDVIMENNAFALDDDDFEDICGFAKPTLDETIVFTCAAGVRSVYACQFAGQAGFSNLVNYVGGSNDWFQ